MSEALRGVVVCHGELATALVEAAESISGVSGVLRAVSNSGCDRDALERRVAEALDGRPAVCLFAVLKHLRTLQGVKVVTGVNLAMLVDFVFHVSLDAGAAAEHAMAAGTRAIRTP
jgi:mannose/fructose-specific phosphotransferase system component IIA